MSTSIALSDLQAKHAKEQRELQSRITQKRKNATKKSRKGVNDECERLERELKERQTAELEQVNGEPGVREGAEDVEGGETAVNQLASLDLRDDNEEERDPKGNDVEAAASPSSPKSTSTSSTTLPAAAAPPRPTSKKRNRAKDRLARRAAAQEASIAAAEAEAASQPDARALELRGMASELEKRELEEIPIRPDGHCLYAAVAMGRGRNGDAGGDVGYVEMRRTAATFMAEHADDFAPFLDETIAEHVRKVRDTAEWGGAVELMALSRALDLSICVLTADGRVERISGQEGRKEGKEVWVAYYRSSFGLGEHYNALRRKTET